MNNILPRNNTTLSSNPAVTSTRATSLPLVLVSCYGCGKLMKRDYVTAFDLTGYGTQIVDICDPCRTEAEQNVEFDDREHYCDTCGEFGPCYNLDGHTKTCNDCQVRRNVAEMHTAAERQRACCDECFSPSQDVDGRAVPEICIDTECECHEIQIQPYRPSLSDHILHTVVVFVLGAIFSAAILANAEDVDALFGLLK